MDNGQGGGIPPAKYFDMIQISSTMHHVEFLTLQGIPGQEGTERQYNIIDRQVTTVPHAKKMMEALKTHLDKWAENHGPIPDIETRSGLVVSPIDIAAAEKGKLH